MSEFVLALAAVFIAAGALLLVANRFELPIVPFYIFAGLGVGFLVAEAALVELALWGIAFLVFVFGIRVDIADLRTVMRDGEVAAMTQLLVVAPIAAGIGYGLGVTFGFEDPVRNALYFSAAATLSSTIIGAHIIEAEIRNNLVFARLASAIHFFDDIVAVGVILILSAEVLTDAQVITSQIGYGVLFILAALVLYRHGYPLLLAASDGDAELVLMGSISILIVFIAAAELVGISIVIGAFAAGLSIRREGAATLDVRNGIESIKDFFAAIFFVTIGALVTVPTVEIVLLSAILVGLILFVNPLIHTGAFILEGYDGRTAFLAGSSLNQMSELALVIAIQAWLAGTIDPLLFHAIIIAGAATMVISALANPYENRFYEAVLAPALQTRTGYIDSNSSVAESLSDHVVVIGYGRQGRQIVETLESMDIQYVVIENDPLRKSALQQDCEHYVFGDAMADYPLSLANVDGAALLISTVDHRALSETMIDRQTDAAVITRADSPREAARLLDAGATFVIVPSVMAVDRLLETLERVLGDESTVDDLQAAHLEFLADAAESELRPKDRTRDRSQRSIEELVDGDH